MKTLEEIEDEVLTELKWTDWKELLHDNGITERKLVVIREIAKRYAEQAIDRCNLAATIIDLDKNVILNVKTELR